MITSTLKKASLCLFAVSSLVVLGMPTTVGAEVSISMMDDKGIMLSTSEPQFVDGDYMWGVDMFVPIAPYDDTAADPPVTGVPVTVTWSFGDGTEPKVVSTTSAGDDQIWCNGEGGGVWRCTSWVGHDYAAAGTYRITATAHQDGATDDTLELGQAMYDVDTGGFVRGSGTVWAQEGGMYDQEFAATGGTLSFSINAKRRAGSSATTGTLVVSVPSMLPDYPDSQTTGMTFTSRTPTMPLSVTALSGGGRDILLDRVYGTVTNSAGRVSSALASFHAILTPGEPTLVRVSVWNTGAGFTFVDTSSSPFPTRWAPDSDDTLLTGLLRVG